MSWGGSPRPILENVYDADISADGSSFAVVRMQGTLHVLEYLLERGVRRHAPHPAVGGGVQVRTGNGSATLYPTLAPALIVVGSMMLKVVREFNWDDPTEYIPAFLILVGIPLTFSIADGIAFGTPVPAPDLAAGLAVPTYVEGWTR